MKTNFYPPKIRHNSLWLFFCLLFSLAVKAQTYTTIANGNWNNAATWQGGTIPDATNIPSTAVINIAHCVTYSGASIINNGTININNPSGISACLSVAGGINFTNNSSGKVFITSATLRQFRFVGGGQSGTSQSGYFLNNGGYVKVKSSFIEIAQDWTNQGSGVVVFTNSSLIIGGNYATHNSAVDTLFSTSVSVGWQNSGSGNFNIGSNNIYFQSCRVEVASTSGNFTISNNVIANGGIDLISLKNNYTGIFSSGKIEFKPGMVTSGLTLQALCISDISNYSPNGKITGPQTQNCSLNYFPAKLMGAAAPSRMNFSLDPVLTSGTDLQVGASYIYQNVAPGMDATVHIDSIVNGAVINVLDDNTGTYGGFTEAFQPQITSGPSAGYSYAVFTFNYNITGTSVHYALDTLKLTALDIDGNSNLYEFDQISAGTGATANYATLNPNISITQVSPGTFFGIDIDGINQTGVDTTALGNMFTVTNTNVSSFTAKLGISTTSAQQSLRLFSLYTKGFVYPTGQTLPVVMESFTATLNNNLQKAALKWSTASETNLNYFSVERSTDGIHFSQVGMVFALGNTTVKTDYAFTDNVTGIQASVVYYRLNIVDADGKSHYSDVRMIKLSGKTDNVIAISAYPNPVVNNINVTIPANWQNQKVLYEIFSANGNRAFQKQVTESSQTESLNMTTMAPGMYVVKVSCNAQVSVQKIIKQ
jgi:hypothetical protein